MQQTFIMTIVFGHYNFNLKTVLPSELGLIDSSYDGIKFQLRQKCAHIFWIPFFPLGKLWAVRKTDNKLYHCPPELENILRNQFPVRTSLWAWSGPLAILAFSTLFSIQNKIQHKRWEKESQANFKNDSDSLLKKINRAQVGDYLLLAVKENYGYNKSIPVKVLGVKGDEIKLGTLFYSYSQSKSANDPEEIAAIEMENGVNDSFTITKQLLAKAVNTNYRQEQSFEGVMLQDIATAGPCLLRNIVQAGGPVLKQVFLDDIRRDGKYFELENKGFPAKADSIISQDSSTTWQLSKQRSLLAGEKIALKCEGDGEAILYCTDKNKKVFRFLLHNMNGYLQINDL